jgi:hypothetical protein
LYAGADRGSRRSSCRAPWIGYYRLFQVVSARFERLGGLPLFTAAWMLV